MTKALDAATQAIDDEMFEIIHNLEIGYIEHTDAAKRMARAALAAALPAEPPPWFREMYTNHTVYADAGGMWDALRAHLLEAGA